MILHGPPGQRQDDAGADRSPRRRARRSRRRARCRPAGPRCGRVIERARQRLARRRPAHDLLPRRDPPLQQGPAGCAAAGGRGGAGDADRRHHREPVLRGQLGAALARPRLRARGARRRTTCACCSTARSQRGECGPAARIEPEALEFLAERSGGDARTALNALELACETAGRTAARARSQHAEDALQRRALLYDRQADSHYDTISAWIKATRGSDPDASLYYLAVMLEGGEDPRFIVRRMVDPRLRGHRQRRPAGAVVATAAAAAVEHVGLPECQFALAQAAIYLSLAPKSDAAKRAVGAARGLHPRARRRAAAGVPALLHPLRRRATTTRTAAPATSRPRS